MWKRGYEVKGNLLGVPTATTSWARGLNNFVQVRRQRFNFWRNQLDHWWLEISSGYHWGCVGKPVSRGWCTIAGWVFPLELFRWSSNVLIGRTGWSHRPISQFVHQFLFHLSPSCCWCWAIKGLTTCVVRSVILFAATIHCKTLFAACPNRPPVNMMIRDLVILWSNEMSSIVESRRTFKNGRKGNFRRRSRSVAICPSSMRLLVVAVESQAKRPL